MTNLFHDFALHIPTESLEIPNTLGFQFFLKRRNFPFEKVDKYYQVCDLKFR